jgi:carbamoyltransferase
MRYVGFSEYYHDAALAIVNEDGTVAFASQSERYSGKKNDSLIPPHMWTFVNNDDHVTFYEDWRLRADTIGGPRTFGGGIRHEAAERKTPMHNALTYDDYNSHHESHCALAFFTRPWESKEDTVMVSVDGSGESESVAIYDHNFNVIKKILSPQSLGLLYSTCVVALGYQQLRDEYIVMGLAPYGQVDNKLYSLLKNCYYWYESNDGKRQRTIVEFEGVSVDGSELMHQFAWYENLIMNKLKF